MRHTDLFDKGWKFIKADPPGAEVRYFDDTDWEDVTVPHDWAIGGPFSKDNDSIIMTITENDRQETVEYSGSTGSLPCYGTGWYRRRFTVGEDMRGMRFFIEFDGVMSNGTVYLNGRKIGCRPYGYSSFGFELTDAVSLTEENLLAVKVTVIHKSSRWYPGAGIYRHVRFIAVRSIYVPRWGSYITTVKADNDEARIMVSTTINNASGEPAAAVLGTEIVPPGKKKGYSSCSDVLIEKQAVVDREIVIRKPFLWDIDSPMLYKAVSSILVSGRIVDRYETWFGIRTLSFDGDGFALNGRVVKLKGVCLHHDLGPLGAAVNRSAIDRRLDILKAMGCNAIRSSHNPPAPELLDACDRKGFLVVDEAFDEWQEAKCENGYNKLFGEWAERDLRDMIRRDRNHPSVIMWSIGNEVPEQGKPGGNETAGFLSAICRDEDASRPVTAAFNAPDDAIKNGLADAVDIPGWNYAWFKYEAYHKKYPAMIQYGSETASCLSSRGEYHFPVEEERPKRHASLQVSSYDLAAPQWGYPPDYEFRAQDDRPFVLGEFVWTGFDYLGEPTPYERDWPSRSSYFGIVDLCGLPKDRYFLYQSHWTKGNVLHLLPHWNWEGREGEITPVYCYTNYDSAELFLNGKSCGVRKKNPAGLFDRYRLMWDDIRYRPGVLSVVAFDSRGRPTARREMKTAGEPSKIMLSPDRKKIKADGYDLCFITVKITDRDGTLCPNAENPIFFETVGPGYVKAVGNGNPISLEPFIAVKRKAFHGMCMCIVASFPGQTGTIRVTASADGLQSARITIGSK
ncbi:MAG: DUF4982 domain-containing protein [Spirochaetales bacterium]|nr:DUF4982 domain-containing protein [Spirochaetales bacterium]